MELTLHPDATAFLDLKDGWNDLLRRSRFDTIFLTWEWQETWWRVLGEVRGPLVLLSARRDGRLTGILPLYLTEESLRSLQVVGCIEVADYLDLIMESAEEEPVYAAFLAWLSGEALASGQPAPAWDLLDLCNQPEASRSHTVLPEMVRARGWTADVVQEDVCPIIELPIGEEDGWEVYLAALDKKERHEIRRKMRRAEREAPDLAFRVVTGGEELPTAMEDFLRLHRLSSADKESFMTEEMETFFREIAAVTAEQGWLRLFFLETDGQSVAAYMCFAYGDDMLVYNSGYDPKANPHLSFGWVLLSRIIQYSIEEGFRRFDFLQGGEDYKHRFGGVDTPIFRTMIRKSES
jgi:CelD/BcsL family acetyltransferase involved in cellulose biosynthesis